MNYIAGGGFILYAIVMFIIRIGSLEKADWTRTIILTLFGLYFLIPITHPYKTRIDPGIEYLDINWLFSKRTKVLDSEIERITLSTNYIFIFRKNKKAIQLQLYGKKHKSQVFEFFTEYAREKKLLLVNQDEQKS